MDMEGTYILIFMDLFNILNRHCKNMNSETGICQGFCEGPMIQQMIGDMLFTSVGFADEGGTAYWLGVQFARAMRPVPLTLVAGILVAVSESLRT